MGKLSTPLKALLCDKVSQVCGDILKENGIDVTFSETKDQFQEQIGSANILVVRSATTVTSDLLDEAKHLKLVVRAGTGVDNVNIEECSKRGVLVMNTPMSNTLSATEHTCALIMALSRHVPQAAKSMKDGLWDRKKYMGTELYGKTLGIIGLGRIGREVAKRMQSFGMKTVGFDPIVTEEEALKCNITKLSLEETLRLSHYLTVHTPLIPQTKYLINSQTLSSCPKGVKVVNCARGGIINEKDLLSALESGQCGGAALDVFELEPPTNSNLIQHEKVISTPHLGASTVEAQKRCGEDAARQIVNFVQGVNYTGALNGFGIMNAVDPKIQPWMSLAYNFGIIIWKYIEKFLMTSFQDVKLAVNLKGCGLKTAKDSIIGAFYTGILKENNRNVNLVNAFKIFDQNKMDVQVNYEESTAAFFSVDIISKETVVWKIGGTSQGHNPTLLYIGNNSHLTCPLTLKDTFLFFPISKQTEIIEQLIQKQDVCGNSLSSIIMPHEKKNESWCVITAHGKLDAPESGKGFEMCFQVSVSPLSEVLPF
ncbi:D-3-phosphoglycerate dehydrogenase [Octopus vulgaris]|uniref:D-3-phosphoglycerate dehydrogenase n=1 Tax=Octopus vulgaris TaxID=6645 RepID=A0AA36B997_OCTVU|nr:D-3-phosphoglycerate dehydrogenase [Octopus vulgaris]